MTQKRHNIYLHFHYAIVYCQLKALLTELVHSGELYFTKTA